MTFLASSSSELSDDAVVAALHRREPRALAGHVVEDEVRERAQQHRVVGAQRLLDRLRMLGSLEDRKHVRAASSAPERLRVVGLDEAEYEICLPRVAVAEVEARLLELLAEQSCEAVERLALRLTEERVLHGARVLCHAPYDKWPSAAPSTGTVSVSARFAHPTTTSGLRIV